MIFLNMRSPSFPVDNRGGPHYCGLNRAPAASANVANAAAVYSRCFNPESFARIRSPPTVFISSSIGQRVVSPHRPMAAHPNRPIPKLR